MAPVFILLGLLCVLLGSTVDAGRYGSCTEDINALKREMNKMMDDNTAPECVKEVGLDEFKCTAGEDEKIDMEVAMKLKEWYKGLDENMKEKAMKCGKEFMHAAMEEAGDKISEECVNKMEEEKKKSMEN
ncbi:hypothetical protein JTE90_005670 [Oedothorax gibbosus]|uniref:Uncharacterized protein n=1 Tax=Oedothorax gibbosus TaxID=931172 RepID=A0AAV6UHU7_9ARAC|nr:hypothetical protein JTE90_005670 [Oedothorax gibbosus]